MRFLLEFVTCCASCSSETKFLPLCSSETQRTAEETKFLVVEEPRRRVRRKRGKFRGRGRGREWRPSLTSISEDVMAAEKINNIERPKRPAAEKINNVERPAAWWRRCLKRKIASLSQRDRSRSLDHDDCRRAAPISAIMPTYSAAAPFMF